MRAGVFYILFVIVALFIVSHKQANGELLNTKPASCQMSSVTVSNDCILPVSTFLLKKVITTSNLWALFNHRPSKNSVYSKIDLQVNKLRLYQTRTIAFKTPLGQKIVLFLIHHYSNNNDDYHLRGK
jgi:hypothetical protein